MTEEERRILELALIGLEAERQKIEKELHTLGERLDSCQVYTSTATTRFTAGTKPRRVSPNKGVRMSEAQKRKISAAMKARWSNIKQQRRS